jgi:hypothetical protein
MYRENGLEYAANYNAGADPPPGPCEPPLYTDLEALLASHQLIG